jgi:hypothetical protein
MVLDLLRRAVKIVRYNSGTTRNRRGIRPWHRAVAGVLLAGAVVTVGVALLAPASWYAWLTLSEDAAASLLLITLLLLCPVSQATVCRLLYGRRRPVSGRRPAAAPAPAAPARRRRATVSAPVPLATPPRTSQA